ncbi:UPF0193 protein EVG1 homolog [Periplaneta americana]|uniref:UPF0193 protein EVG1 homolog n=1 Tax=Periplaneta americana TaxID=6978 RepID=UPI0037E732DA
MSSRVIKGEGILHAHKVQYSKETHQLLKTLLEESKLSILQRQKIQKSVHNGESLPPLSCSRTIKSGVRVATSATIKKHIFHKKRTKDTIIQSGAYERDPFIPLHPKVDKEKEKQRLQSLMAFGKVVPQTPVHKTRQPAKTPLKTPKEVDRFTELLEGVQDRLQFLLEMKELGHEKKYRTLIEQQVAANTRQMKALDPQRYQQLGIVGSLL